MGFAQELKGENALEALKDLTVSNGKATINDIQEDQTITAAFRGVDVVVTFVVDSFNVIAVTV